LETEARINAVYRRLVANFRETIFQSEIAASVGLSPAAFSRFSGTRLDADSPKPSTTSAWGTRVNYCVRRGKRWQRPVMPAGFENLANFNRQFRRRHGLSPTEWRVRIDQSQCAREDN
jgi:AraC-like DNA-binding protein